jgi:hypothetical protein
VAAIVFIAQDALQTLAGPAHIHDVLNGVQQTIPRGPVASQEAIKQLGTTAAGSSMPTGRTRSKPGRADQFLIAERYRAELGCSAWLGVRMTLTCLLV